MKLLNKIFHQPFNYFLALLIVFGNGSWLQSGYNAPFKAVFISSLFLYIIMFYNKKILGLGLPIAMIVPLLLIFSTLLNFSYQSNVNTLLSTFSIVFILSILNKKSIINILDKYAEIILGLIYVSFAISIIKIIYPELPSHFSSVNFGVFSNFKNLFLFVDSTKNGLSPFRVQGIFWEPGAWAVNQAIAFYWYMIYKKDYKKFYIFLASSILTASSSGLLFTFIFSSYLFFDKIDNSLTSMIKKSILTISIFVFIVFFYASTKYFVLIPSNGNQTGNLLSIATRTVLFQTVEKFYPGGVSYGSNESRLETYFETFKLSKHRPLLGVGMLKYKYRPFVTSVFGELIYQCGYLFTLLWVFLFSQLFKPIPFKYAAPLIFILLNAEAYAFGSLFILIIVLGSKILFNKTPLLYRTLV
jgi:hypothetical protein